MPRYSIRENRIMSGSLTGLVFDPETGEIGMDPESVFHSFFLRGIDSTETGNFWGRLSFKIDIDPEMIFCTFVFSTDINDFDRKGERITLDDFLTDPDIPPDEKLAVLKNTGAVRYVGQNDILLYSMKGRYLYIAFDIRGNGKARFSNIRVDSPGDFFLDSFPEIYREENSFFHRYISIFSSIYNDFQDDINALPEILDLNTCPLEMLIEYGSWMGIDLKGGFLSEDVIRDIVKEAYELNKIKGTVKCLRRLLTIILREEPVIIEHNLVRSWIREENIDYPQNFKPRGVYDVTILIKKRITEEVRHQVMYMADQFKPVRTRIFIAQMDENAIIDSNTYLDINTKLPEKRRAVLDGDLSLDGTVVL